MVERLTSDQRLLLGYFLRGVASNCLLVVPDQGCWYLDLDARPVSVASASEGADADLKIVGSAAAMLSLLERRDSAELRSLIDRRVLRVSGAERATEALYERVGTERVSVMSWFPYPLLAESLGRRFTFMNHGFSAGANEDLTWVEEVDHDHRYEMNLIQQVLEEIDLRGKSILDIGCGRGGACAYLVQYREPLGVVGLDLFQEAVDQCRATHPSPRLSFVQGDAHRLPFADDSFDVILNVESSHNYPDFEAFLREVRRVLAPGGVFCWADIVHSPSPDRQLAALGRVGAKLIRTENITEGVLRALELDRVPYQTFVGSLLDPTIGNHGVVELVKSLKHHAWRSHAGGRTTYWSWQAAFEAS